MFVDTHCHVEMIAEMIKNPAQNQSVTQIVNKIVRDAHEAGVVAIVTVGTTLATGTTLVTEYLQIPGIFGTIGLHPCDATDGWQQDMLALEKLFDHSNLQKIVGVGECGLDFYHPGFIVKRQQDVFRAHIELALKHDLPLVIHTRNAFDATLAIVDEYHGRYHTGAPAGIFHCFSEDAVAAHKVVDRGFLIGIGGAVTYPKNDSLRNVVRSVGLDNIVLETDAPFLPPQGFRGTVNTPAHIATIARFLADFLGYSDEKIAEKTSANARRVFRKMQLSQMQIHNH